MKKFKDFINESSSDKIVISNEKIKSSENSIREIIKKYGLSRINDEFVNVKGNIYYADGSTKAEVSDTHIYFYISYRDYKLPNEFIKYKGIFENFKQKIYIDLRLYNDSLSVNGEYYKKTKESIDFFKNIKNIITKESFVSQAKYLHFDKMEKDLKNYIKEYGVRNLNGVTLDDESHFNLALEMTSQRCSIKYDDDKIRVSFPYSNSIANHITKSKLDLYKVSYNDSDDGILFNIFKSKSNEFNGDMFGMSGSSVDYSNFDDFMKFKQNMIDFIETNGLSEWEVDENDYKRGMKNLRRL